MVGLEPTARLSVAALPTELHRHNAHWHPGAGTGFVLSHFLDGSKLTPPVFTHPVYALPTGWHSRSSPLYAIGFGNWSWNSESNRAPSLYEGNALPFELFQQMVRAAGLEPARFPVWT